MEVEELKNYGKPLKIPGEVPKDIRNKVENESINIIKKNVGWMKLIKIILLTMKDEWKMSHHDWSALREKGMDDRKFLEGQVEMTALFSAVSETTGKEKALKIFKEIIEMGGPEEMGSIMPKPEEFKKVGDPFEAFKKYFMALVKVDKEEGIHNFEVIEDTKDAFQVNITYCAYCEIAKQLGIVEACQPSCDADDVFFPKFCEEMGFKFVRKGTLARGDKVCDFRYERNISSSQ